MVSLTEKRTIYRRTNRNMKFQVGRLQSGLLVHRDGTRYALVSIKRIDVKNVFTKLKRRQVVCASMTNFGRRR